MKLYEHEAHPHLIHNANRLHEQERMQGNFNQRFAVLLTKSVSSMSAAYLFTVLALIGLFGLFGWLNPFVFLLTTWISQQFIQLVCLPILGVSQSVIERKQEIQAEEQFKTTQNSFHDIEQIVNHLNMQDAELLKQDEILSKQNDMMLQILQRLDKPARATKKSEVVK